MLSRYTRLLPIQARALSKPVLQRGIFESRHIRKNVSLNQKLMNLRSGGNISLFSTVPPKREASTIGDRFQNKSTVAETSTSSPLSDAEKNNDIEYNKIGQKVDDGDDATTKAARKKKMSYKDLIKQYGTLAVGFHSVVWTGTLGVTWALVFANADAALRIFELVPFLDRDMLPDEASEFLIAYTLTSVTGPARFGLDVVAMPWLAKRLKASPRFAAWIPGLPTSAINSAAAAAEGIVVDVTKPVPKEGNTRDDTTTGESKSTTGGGTDKVDARPRR